MSEIVNASGPGRMKVSIVKHSCVIEVNQNVIRDSLTRIYRVKCD